MAFKEVKLPEIGNVKIYKRRGVSGLRLTLPSTGGVRVSMPKWLPYQAGVEFVMSKKDWILEHAKHEKLLENGQMVGKSYQLVLQPSNSERISTRITGGTVLVSYPSSADENDEAVQSAARNACLRALKKEAREQITKRLNELVNETGYSYKSVNFKQMKSRWGHCSSNKDITFNIFLVQLPWELIDYVVIHELIHTKVLSHGPEFWEEFSKYFESPKQLRKKLKDYNPSL